MNQKNVFLCVKVGESSVELHVYCSLECRMEMFLWHFTGKYEKHALMTFQRGLRLCRITVVSTKIWTEQMTSFILSFIYIYSCTSYTSILFNICVSEIHFLWSSMNICTIFKWEQLILKYPFKLKTQLLIFWKTLNYIFCVFL